MPEYVVKKAIAQKAHKHGFNVSGAAYDALDKMIQSVIEGATKRAKANKRKTIMPHDF